METQKLVALPADAPLAGGNDSAEFITQEELLVRVPISRRTAFLWRKKGKLPAVQIGQKILFHWPTVRNALLRQQQGSAEGQTA